MKAVILAGGLGSRLKPFTDIIPKPLLPLGEKSLMEHQIEHLKNNGFNEIFIAVNYKAEYIQSYLGNGERYGVKIEYSIEDKPLGTCGPITLIKEKLDEPFLLINGDILTSAKLKNIFEYALEFPESFFTDITKVITTPFRYSNLTTDDKYIYDVEEKPDLHFEILAGIYVIKPEIFKYIPTNEYFGIDNLIHKMLELKLPITKYQIKDYWIDIGAVEDYEKARIDISSNYKKED